MFIGKSSKAKFAEDWMIRKLSEARKSLDKSITCDINAKMLFYFPKDIFTTKKGDRSKKLNDLSNLIELPADVMQKVSIINNDQQIVSLDGSRRIESPDEHYWLEITLTEAV
jgi:Holliday junction resolvase RusA-like endonuclease